MNKKIVFACINTENYSPVGMSNGLEALGFQVFMFDWQQVRFQRGVDAVRMELLEMVNTVQPAITFLHIQTEGVVTPELARAMRYVSKVVNYTYDVRSKEKTEWMYKLASEVDLTCFACKEDVDECLSRGITNVVHSHSSCDVRIYKPYFGPEKRGIVFLGNNFVNTNLDFDNAVERENMIAFLKQNYGNDFSAYGLGQENQMTSTVKEIETYNLSQIAICHNNLDRTDYCSDRVWRAISCGSFVIHKHFPGIEKLFNVGEHIAVWKDFDDLKAKIDYHLKFKMHLLASTKDAYSHLISNHTWKHRFEKIINSIPMDSVFNSFWQKENYAEQPEPVSQEYKCLGGHKWGGKMPSVDPSLFEIQNHDLIGKPCDCGRVVYNEEPCGCSNKQWKIKETQNMQ